ncbi:MAG: ParB/RepB/Spo0J family partition protein, partial [Candidatus Binatia bacterium]
MKKSFTEKLSSLGASRPQPRDADFAKQLGINQKRTMTMLSLDVILPNPKNPRRSRSAQKFEELKESIKALGVLQAITVRPAFDQPGRYYVTFGEGRFLAAKDLGLSQIPATIKEQTEDEALIEAIAENVNRENMSSVDRARALVDLREALSKSAKFALSWDEVLTRAKTGLSRRQLFNYLGLLRLPEAIQEEIRSGVLSEQHGRALAKLLQQPDLLANAHAYMRTKKLSGPDS